MKATKKLGAIALMIASPALAGEQVGTLTQVQGDVKLFSHPTKTLPASEPGVTRALFEGEYFVVNAAKPGDKVEKGNIVRTAPNGKTHVVYDNGDQFNVGPGTAYRVNWEADTAKSNTQITLAYGKFRGIVEKGGPRSKLQIRTNSAVMGVRGTDFFIASNGADNSTEVSIIRGAVEVKPAAPAAKAVEVKAGQSAEIQAAAPMPEKKLNGKAAPAPATVEAKVELRQTTQEDLQSIQKASKIEKGRDVASAAAPEVQKKIAALEKKAVDTTLNDIKATDAKLYAEVSKEMARNPKADSLALTEVVNSKSIDSALKTAPKAPEKRKPYKSEMEDLEAGAYDRYFKTVQ